ncbi:YadA C-terminal domain-containing protein [Fusobacterium necrophorum]|uniref:YadA C-terminal domain-containing protein n=1 Tax=Fusobacterium necrophorum TaxID=859 RepID=UPI0021C2E51E|nr:YadA C-terminal domain-containing protein [Fusobacterium necrophorum]MDK4520877.1 YadA C-terminal domain-containing protein [Fusobacterium necrophorum]
MRIKVSKSINDVVDDNFSKTLLFGLPNPINIGVKTGIKSVFSILDKRIPELKPLLKLTGYNLSTFPDEKLLHFKELHGERVAEEFQKTNKAFNEAEKKWAETANFVMKNKSVLEEHNQKIVKNESEIGELRTNVENNYYTKEDTYSKVEVNTQLETKVDKKEFHDYQNDVKKEMETSKSELRTEVNTQLDTKVDKKEFYDYQNDVKKEMETSKSELRTEVNTQLDTKVDKKEFYDYQNDVKKEMETSKSELRTEVNTQLETKVDKKEFHDYQNDVKKEMETSKSELRTEVNTQLDTKVDKKEFYDYQNDVKKDIENTKSELRHVGSLSAALSGLHPMQYDKNNPNQVMASLGSYKDKQAVAVGLTHYFKENLMMTGGIALADDKKVKTMASLGITYKFGKGGESSEDEDLKKMVQAQAQEIQEMKEQLRVLMSK